MPALLGTQKILHVEHQGRARVDVHLVRVRVARVVVGLERDQVGVEPRARQPAQLRRWPLTWREELADGVGEEEEDGEESEEVGYHGWLLR